MADGWGYIRRADNPDRMVPVPPQNTPDSALPSDVADAVRHPVAAAAQVYQVIYAQQCNNTRLLAQTNLQVSSSGGGGGAVDTEQTWYTRIARFCRKRVHTHTTGGMGQSMETIHLDQSIWALVSSAAPGAPFVLRAEDIFSGELTFTGSGSMAIHFGFRSNVSSIATLVPDNAFIGFYCSATAVGYATWKCGVWGDGGASVDEVTTAYTSELPHRLRIDIDAQAGEVRFYIDDTLVHTSSAVAPTASQTNDDGGLVWILCCGGSGAHTATATMGYWMERANLSLRVLDEAA